MGIGVAGPERDIIVVGASAGGVEALTELCRRLPGNLNAAVFIVLHIAPTAPGLLPTILQRYTSLPALFPTKGQAIEYGRIYIAPPNRHLILHPGWIEISSGPRENLMRPSVDALFRSAAEVFGPRVAGVILSGTRSDGTIGLQLIKNSGGVAIVQNPEEAMFSSMPASALKSLEVDFVLGVSGIAEMLIRLSGTQVESPPSAPQETTNLQETINPKFTPFAQERNKEPNKPPRQLEKKDEDPRSAPRSAKRKREKPKRDNGLSRGIMMSDKVATLDEEPEEGHS